MRKVHCPFDPKKKTYSSAHSLRFHVEMNHGVSGEDMVKAIVNKVVIIPDGKHLGIIRGLEERKTEVYGAYVDIKVEVSDVPEGKIVFGMPLNVSIQSDLGKFLINMGFPVAKNEGKDIDLDKILIGRNITFQTHNEKVEKGKFSGEFARVLKETIAPAEQNKDGSYRSV
jgi:hypothetical protein